MKTLVDRYTFTPASKTVKLLDYTTVRPDGLVLIVNVTRGEIIYSFTDPAKGAATISGNVVTLEYDTTAHNANDALQIYYNGAETGNQVRVASAGKVWQDGIDAETQPDTAVWDVVNTNTDHMILRGGDALGSQYIRMSMNPLVEASDAMLVSKETFRFPLRAAYGLSISQRIVGQEIFAGFVACNDDGTLDLSVTPNSDIAITGTTISVTSNVGTVTLTNHGLKGGDRVNLYGCPASVANVGPVIVTVVDRNTFTVPLTASNGSYNCTGGMVRPSDPLRFARDGAGYLFENASVTNGSVVSRRSGGRFYSSSNQTVGTTTATQSNSSPLSDAFMPTTVYEIQAQSEEIDYRTIPWNSNGATTAVVKQIVTVPNEQRNYKLVVRARDLVGQTRPVGRITAITKSGSTTATITTDVAHGLTTDDTVSVVGVLDQTNFINTTSVAVASIVNSTQFTCVIPTSATASSSGGTVFRIQGGVVHGSFSSAVQSVSRTGNIMTLIGNATWATPLPGEYVQVHGMTGSAAQYDGAYKVLRVSTTTLELESTGADFGSIATGGHVWRRTDVRLHAARVSDHTRLIAEVIGGRGNLSDISNAVPVAMTTGVVQSTGISTTQWSAAGWGGFLVADQASAAITTTATSAAVSPGSLVNVGTYAHTFHVAVTAVSGTNPTYDLSVEESPDNGTNWVRIYDFPRITATGSFQSPLIPAKMGTRYRYVETIGGSSPSFTRVKNRVQFSSDTPYIRQWVDRSIVLTTLNSTTPTYVCDGSETLGLILNVGAITTTAPQIQVEGSEDAANWYSIGTPLTAVASSTVVAFNINSPARFVRARVSTAGVGVTAGYLSLKALGR